MSWHVWRLKREDVVKLAHVRYLPGLEVRESDGLVWLRANEPSDELQAKLVHLPAIQSVTLADGQLVDRGKRVPQGYLPEDSWVRLTDWIQIRLPTGGFSGLLPESVPLRMQRQDRVQRTDIMLTSFFAWDLYATSAPQVRLDQLAFAVNATQQVVVRGTPLPPIQGVHFVTHGPIAVEAGWTWSPAIALEVLAQVMQLQSGQTSLLYSNGSWTVLNEVDFAKATRASVRATAEELNNAP
ncbi:hypothetical protein GC197_00215 [bacterium]|nr:hypothetical protein [bacterium]